MKLEKRIMMKKSTLFDLSYALILFIFMNLFVTTSLFIFKCPISVFNFIISLLVTVGVYVLIMRKKDYSVKRILSLISVFVLIVFGSILVSGAIYDSSYDGNSYHKTAVGELKMGWNPVYESIDGFNEKSETHLYNTFALWNDHYGKGYWIYAANVYKLTNNIETGKSINIITIIATALMCFYFFQDKLSKKLNLLMSFLIAFNPVILCQIGTFYNDGVLGNFLIMMILSLSLVTLKNEKFFGFQNYVLYFLILCVLINIKFTGFAYAGIYSLAYYVYFLINKEQRKINVKWVTITAVVALAIGVGVIGLSTYPKNLLEHGNPFYPLYGEGSTDIMEDNTPYGLREMNPVQRFAVSNFSASMNDLSEGSIGYKLRMPFIFRSNELKAYTYPDARVGGYGVWFSGILLVSVFALIYSLDRQRSLLKNFKYMLPLFVTLLLVLIIKESWWARYLPQLYLFPIIIILMLRTLDKERIGKFLERTLLVLLCINILLVAIPVGGGLVIRNREAYQEFSVIKAHGGHWNIASEEFSGALFNVIDEIDNVKLVEKCEENVEKIYAMNGKVCVFEHNKE